MAEMVWCNSCKTVVWAYEHQKPVDLRGICNMLQLPCPKCGAVGNFDGWASDNFEGADEAIRYLIPSWAIYDWWSAMKAIAESYKIAWEPSPDNTWLRRPDTKEGGVSEVL